MVWSIEFVFTYIKVENNLLLFGCIFVVFTPHKDYLSGIFIFFKTLPTGFIAFRQPGNLFCQLICLLIWRLLQTCLNPTPTLALSHYLYNHEHFRHRKAESQTSQVTRLWFLKLFLNTYLWARCNLHHLMYGWAGGSLRLLLLISNTLTLLSAVPTFPHWSYFHLFSLITGLDWELSVTRPAFTTGTRTAPTDFLMQAPGNSDQKVS